MTDLERRALLGDIWSQEECTRKRILLPCWRCGGEAEVKQVSTVGRPLFAVSCKKHYCGAYGCAHRTEKEAISYWNTRPAPPIGRCASCACWDENTCECVAAADIEVAYHRYTEPDFVDDLFNAPAIDPETLPIVRQLREELARVTEERDAAVRDRAKLADYELSVCEGFALEKHRTTFRCANGLYTENANYGNGAAGGRRPHHD